MKFSERKEIAEKRQLQKELLHHSLQRHLRKIIFLVIALIAGMTVHEKREVPPAPAPDTIAAADTLATIEGRRKDIALNYPDAKIIAESKRTEGIVSVFETKMQHSFAIYGPAESPAPGYEWTCYYYGALFPKEDMVRGTIALPGAAEEYEVYLLGKTKYDSLEITRTDVSASRLQQERIYFDEAGIAALQLDPTITDPTPRIIAYDADGKSTVFADGKE